MKDKGGVFDLRTFAETKEECLLKMFDASSDRVCRGQYWRVWLHSTKAAAALGYKAVQANLVEVKVGKRTKR
jgi:hypothetical protein